MEEKKRSVGVFLCKCGTNIAGAVDMDALQKWAKERGDVAWVATHELLCSPTGKDFVKETVEKQPCDSVLIAACSPTSSDAKEVCRFLFASNGEIRTRRWVPLSAFSFP